MRLSALVLSTLFFSALSAQADIGTTLLTCSGGGFEDLAKIEVKRTDFEGSLVVVETAADGAVSATLVDEESVRAEKKIPLSQWFGYERAIEIYGDGGYALIHRDECSGGASTVFCTGPGVL